MHAHASASRRSQACRKLVAVRAARHRSRQYLRRVVREVNSSHVDEQVGDAVGLQHAERARPVAGIQSLPGLLPHGPYLARRRRGRRGMQARVGMRLEASRRECRWRGEEKQKSRRQEAPHGSPPIAKVPPCASRSGRRRSVRSMAWRLRQLATAPWSPSASTSGTDMPR